MEKNQSNAQEKTPLSPEQLENVSGGTKSYYFYCENCNEFYDEGKVTKCGDGYFCKKCNAKTQIRVFW